MSNEENFLDNPFYIALTRQYPDLYAKACEKNCVICIPRLSSLSVLMKGAKRGGNGALFVRKPELALHILYPAAAALQVYESGLFECVQSGYTVKIDPKKGEIRGYPGFARNFVAKIVSEEKCYNDHGKSFTVLILDRLLGEGMDIQQNTAPALNLSLDHLSVASCEEFLRNSIHPADPDPILSRYKKAIEQLYLTYHLLPDYLEDLASKINRIVNIALEDAAKVSPKTNKKNAKAALEIYGHAILHKKIFRFLLDVVCKKADVDIRKNFAAVKKPDSISGLNISTAELSTAENALQKIIQYESPFQQLLCMDSVLRGLQQDLLTYHQTQLRTFRTSVENITLTGDDILSLLLYLIVSQKMQHLPSIVKYVHVFCEPIADANLQYSFTTFEAALKYLENPSQDVPDYDFRKKSAELNSRVEEWEIPVDSASLRQTPPSTTNSPVKPLERKFGETLNLLGKLSPSASSTSVSSRSRTSPLDNVFGSFGSQK